MNSGQVHEGLRLQAQALALFTELRDKAGMAVTLDLLAMTWSIVGDLSQAYDHAERAIPLLRELDDKRSLVSSLSIALRTTFTYETLVESDPAPVADARRLDEAQRLSRQMQWPDGEATVAMLRGPSLALLGDFDAGLAASAEGLQIATRIEHREWIAGANHALGAIYCMLMQPELALPYLQAGLQVARALSSALWSGMLSTELALAHSMQNEPAAARAVLEAAWPRDQSPQLVYERRLAWAWARWALANGEPAAALRTADELLASAPGAQAARPIPALLLLRAEALAALGLEGEGGAQRARSAEQSLLDAARGAERLRQPVWQWPVYAALARLYRQLGRGAAAEAAAAQARAIIAALAASTGDAALRAEFVQRAGAQLQ